METITNMSNTKNCDAFYGKCKCGTALQADWYKEFEYHENSAIKTGRHRMNINVLFCPNCLENYTVDDSFAGPWQS